jgi:hypothetical protein
MKRAKVVMGAAVVSSIKSYETKKRVSSEWFVFSFSLHKKRKHSVSCARKRFTRVYSVFLFYYLPVSTIVDLYAEVHVFVVWCNAIYTYSPTLRFVLNFETRKQTDTDVTVNSNKIETNKK